jgi:hypothetical protein
MLYYALLGGFWVYPFLKSTCTDFVGVGLVKTVFSGGLKLEWSSGRW